MAECRCHLLVGLFGFFGLLNRGAWIAALLMFLNAEIVHRITSGDRGLLQRFGVYFSAGGCFYLLRNLIR